jgi:hypothetical protein
MHTDQQIPAFGLYKIYILALPLLRMFLPGIFGPKAPQDPNAPAGAAAGADKEPAESRKQAKLRARMERGDKRIQQVQRKQ